MQTNPVHTAFLTGWQAVEAFGLLRRYTRFGKPGASEKPDANRRFNFTRRDPNLAEQLTVALQRLRALSAVLVPNLLLPIPTDPDLLLEGAKKDLPATWQAFESWSNQVWVQLQSHDPLIGQAFACGGDLADTFWFAQGAGAPKLAETLRSYRLAYLAERLADLSSHLPEQSARLVCHSLARWSIGERLKDLDEASQKRLLERLESQIKVWRDLLFGLRPAASYFTPRDRQRIRNISLSATLGTVILAALVAWGAVLLLASVGRLLLGGGAGLAEQANTASAAVLEKLADWQNWSSLLATLSSVFVVLTGFISRLSGWMIAFYRAVENRLAEQTLYRRTYRSASFEHRAGNMD